MTKFYMAEKLDKIAFDLFVLWKDSLLDNDYSLKDRKRLQKAYQICANLRFQFENQAKEIKK